MEQSFLMQNISMFEVPWTGDGNQFMSSAEVGWKAKCLFARQIAREIAAVALSLDRKVQAPHGWATSPDILELWLALESFSEATTSIDLCYFHCLIYHHVTALDQLKSIAGSYHHQTELVYLPMLRRQSSPLSDRVDNIDSGHRAKRCKFDDQNSKKITPTRPQLPSPAPSLAPLTADNLRTHTMQTSRSNRSISPRKSKSQSPKKRKSQSPEKHVSSRSVLEAHNIFILQRKPLPPEIKSLVDKLRLGGEDKDRTADIKAVMRISPFAATANERDGKRLLERDLFYQEAILGGKPGLAITEDQNLAKHMLPPAVSMISPEPLKIPQADTVVGYVRNEMMTIYNNIAQSKGAGSVQFLFTTEEAQAAIQTRIVDAVDLPWFSCQWKARRNGGTHKAAEDQGARDGAAILNYNHKLLTLTDFDHDVLISPPVDGQLQAALDSTVHFSSTIDLETVNMYVHWIDFDQTNTPSSPPRAQYRMEKIFTKDLADEQHVGELRQFLDNLYEWAMHIRLPIFKAALGRRFRQLADQPELAMPEPDVDCMSTTSTSISTGWKGTYGPTFDVRSEVEGSMSEERISKRR